MRYLIFYILFFVCCFCNASFAQEHIWKKDITHSIELNDTMQVSFARLLTSAIIQKRIKAYHNKAGLPSAYQVKEDYLLHIKPFQSLIVLEEWSFDPVNLTMRIKLKAVAPIVNDTGFRGSITADTWLWVMLEDFKLLCSRPENQKVSTAIARALWNEYFYSVKDKNSTPVPTTKNQMVFHTVDIHFHESDYREHRFLDQSPDTNYTDVLIQQIEKGQLVAYRNSNLDSAYTKKEFRKMFIVKNDPDVSDGPREIFSELRPEVSSYKLLEEWSYDPQKAETTIQVKNIAPTVARYNEDGSFREYKALFWVPLKEFKAALNPYEQYNPQETLSTVIWNNYFK